MHYANDMTPFREPIYDDPTAREVLLENMVMLNITSSGINIASYNNNVMMSNNMLQYSTVTTTLWGLIYNVSTTGMSLEKYMMMFNGPNTAGTAISSIQTQR